MHYQVVIGLEVHIQLLTERKIFANEGFVFGDPPNQHVSPITLAHPGALPSINRRCLTHAIRLGLATECRISRHTYFARKNYFYPDLPKGYQLSQHLDPICENGSLELYLPDSGLYKSIQIERIHLEEDAGKLIHDQHPQATLVDLNRAGVGLVELVTRPDLRSAEEAGIFLAEIRKLVRYLEISDGNMEEGSLRCDANVSLMPAEAREYGTRVEIKNINSISNLIKAIQAEVRRQTQRLQAGESITQETRTWDAQRQDTSPMRDKESADDYRYFPEPDLQPVQVSDAELTALAQQQPVLPMARFKHYFERFQLPYNESMTLVENRAFSDYFEAVCNTDTDPKSAANWLLGPVRAYMNEQGLDLKEFPLSPAQIAALIRLVSDNQVSFTAAKEQLFPALLADPSRSPARLAESLNLLLVDDTEALEAAMQALIKAHPDEVKRYRNGKKALRGFFVGQLMRNFKGKADPQAVNQVVAKQLDAS